MIKQLLGYVKGIVEGIGLDDVLIVIGAVLLFRGLWYWDPALSFVVVGALALVLGILAVIGIFRRRRG